MAWARSTHFQCSIGWPLSCKSVSNCCRPAWWAGPPGGQRHWQSEHTILAQVNTHSNAHPPKSLIHTSRHHTPVRTSASATHTHTHTPHKLKHNPATHFNAHPSICWSTHTNNKQKKHKIEVLMTDLGPQPGPAQASLSRWWSRSHLFLCGRSPAGGTHGQES